MKNAFSFKTAVFVFLCFLTALEATAQDLHRFDKDVAAIQAYDKMYELPPHPIVFTGSSTIRKWSSLQVAFGGYNVINRGVGGTVIDEITRYMPELVFAYNPRQIVLYAGDNDLPNEQETADTIYSKTVTLFNAIRAKLPDVPIVYLSIKPSPSREKYMPKAVAANRLIAEYIKNQKNMVFVDVYNPMLQNGKPRPELFLGDRLHMQPAGYAIWEQILRPVLAKKG